jgi:hypothetical protein
VISLVLDEATTAASAVVVASITARSEDEAGGSPSETPLGLGRLWHEMEPLSAIPEHARGVSICSENV